MYFEIYDENRAIIDCQNKYIGYIGIALFITSIGIILVTVLNTILFGYSQTQFSASIVLLAFVLPIGYISYFHKNVVLIDHSIGKINRQTDVLGIYKWIRNDWNINEVVKLDTQDVHVESDEHSAWHTDHFLQLTNGEKITIFTFSSSCSDIIKEFNLFLKQKYTDNIKVECN
ncbi:MAG: hypothetical protein ACXAC7_00375 [Candidatus Hodarchaeales archaeon]|jgi:hypothetical protein